MKKVILIASVVLLSGCATSSYENFNTPQGNVVRATGKAAENAATVNTSHYGSQVGQSRQASQGRPQASLVGDIFSSALRTVGSSTSNQINSEIRQAIRGF